MKRITENIPLFIVDWMIGWLALMAFYASLQELGILPMGPATGGLILLACVAFIYAYVRGKM